MARIMVGWTDRGLFCLEKNRPGRDSHSECRVFVPRIMHTIK